MTQTEARAVSKLMVAEENRNHHNCQRCQEDLYCKTFANLTDKYAKAVEVLRSVRGKD